MPCGLCDYTLEWLVLEFQLVRESHVAKDRRISFLRLDRQLRGCFKKSLWSCILKKADIPWKRVSGWVGTDSEKMI